MITKLRLKDFKNFRDATLHLGRVTTLVGANASGKSNIRDAFRFLHGAARGYSLAEIFDQKFTPSGELVWEGIRGGSMRAPRLQDQSFRLELSARKRNDPMEATYCIEVACPDLPRLPTVLQEEVQMNQRKVWDVARYRDSAEKMTTISQPIPDPRSAYDSQSPMMFRGMQKGILERGYAGDHIHLVQGMGYGALPPHIASPMRESCALISAQLSHVRFMDLQASVMRAPCEPSQAQLGARGENLAAVLLRLLNDDKLREILIGWINAILPYEVTDILFERYGSKVQFVLVENGGARVSAESASDGTILFLGYLTALVTAGAGGMFFFEEPENGIHPARLSHLVELFETKAVEKNLQIILTTHSPMTVDALSDESKKHVFLLYRDKEGYSGEIVRAMDIPNAEKFTEEDGLGHLLSTRWLEQATYFNLPDAPPAEVAQ